MCGLVRKFIRSLAFSSMSMVGSLNARMVHLIG
jgi:hypothetical protein